MRNMRGKSRDIGERKVYREDTALVVGTTKNEVVEIVEVEGIDTIQMETGLQYRR